MVAEIPRHVRLIAAGQVRNEAIVHGSRSLRYPVKSSDRAEKFHSDSWAGPSFPRYIRQTEILSMLRKSMIVVTLATALAACGSQGPGDAGNSDVTAATKGAVAEAAPAADRVVTSGYLPLPGRLELFTTAYHIRSDRFRTNRHGAVRRLVIYEFTTGDMASVLAEVESAMQAAGYSAKTQVEGKGGSFTIPFSKKGTPRLRVKFVSDVGQKPANPDAKFLVAVDWQVKAAPKK